MLFISCYNVKKSFVCFGPNTSLCFNISSCWQRITVWLAKINSEILQSTHLHNAHNLNNGQKIFLYWIQIKYSPVNLSKRSTFPIWWGLVKWHHQHFFLFSFPVTAIPEFKQLLRLWGQTTLKLVGWVIIVSWFLLLNLTKLIFRIFSRTASTSCRLGLVNQ